MRAYLPNMTIAELVTISWNIKSRVNILIKNGNIASFS